ncbi:hypothetical protein SNE40_016749 [Patella caerulea]|uniref:EGF-like domain-containing protein n=1 Tax=Patella caerulea TaxID=87958 RepID=A0AAN8J977_PATCE
MFRLCFFITLCCTFSTIKGLNLYDEGCTLDDECPGVAKCLSDGCLGNTCLCPEGYQPDDDYTGCVKVVELGEPCNSLDVRCRLPFAMCRGGKCECKPPYMRAADNMRCKLKSVSINSGWALLGETCDSQITCTEGNTMLCEDAKCVCKAEFRPATEADKSAHPYNGECISTSYTLGEDITASKDQCVSIPEGSLTDIGSECIADTNCPGNATCRQVGCNKKCACEKNFAPSGDRQNCLQLITLHGDCNENTVCETLFSRCSNIDEGGECVCDVGYSENNLQCRKISNFPGHLQWASINETCGINQANVPVKCQSDLECISGICKCDTTFFREATIHERISFNPPGYCISKFADLELDENDSACDESITNSTQDNSATTSTPVPPSSSSPPPAPSSSVSPVLQSASEFAFAPSSSSSTFTSLPASSSRTELPASIRPSSVIESHQTESALLSVDQSSVYMMDSSSPVAIVTSSDTFTSLETPASSSETIVTPSDSPTPLQMSASSSSEIGFSASIRPSSVTETVQAESATLSLDDSSVESNETVLMDSSSVTTKTTSIYIGVVTNSAGTGMETTDNFTGLPTSDSTSLIIQSSVDINSRSALMATSSASDEMRSSMSMENMSESLETSGVESSTLSENSVEVGSLSASIQTTSRPQIDRSSIDTTTSTILGSIQVTQSQAATHSSVDDASSTIDESVLSSMQVSQSQIATHSSVDSTSFTIDESILGSVVTNSQAATQSLNETSGSQLPIASSSSVKNLVSDDINTSYGSVDGTSSIVFATEVLSQSAQLSVGVISSQLSQQLSSDPGQIGSTVESFSASSVSQLQSSEVVTSIPTPITTPATAKLGIDDSCDDDVSCPDNSVCHQTTCSGKRCQCQDGYFSANKGMACLKAVKLGELCNETITCAVPFSQCDGGICVCGRPFIRTTPNGFCADDRPTVGEACTDTCREFEASCGSDKICSCNSGFRVAEDAEVYAAGPVWILNGRCFAESQEPAPECVPLSIGDNCTAGALCPGNSTCTPATGGCINRCWCDVGFAPSSDKKSCLPVVKIGDACSRESTRCISPLSRCINGQCECYRGFTPVVNNTGCKPQDYPPYVSIPALGEDCNDQNKRCFMKQEQICGSSGVCECRQGLRPAAYEDLVAEYYNMQQCRNESFTRGYRPTLTCSEPPVPLMAEPDDDETTSVAGSPNQILSIVVPTIVVVAGILATIYSIMKWRRRRRITNSEDSGSSSRSECDSEASFRLPRPHFIQPSLFRDDRSWNNADKNFHNPLYNS